jgi:hypothetical protein
MANGELIQEVDCLLEADDITSKSAQRLMLKILGELYKKQEEMNKKVVKMYPAYQGLMWLGAILGVTVVALVWSIITHQVQIVW